MKQTKPLPVRADFRREAYYGMHLAIGALLVVTVLYAATMV